MTWAGVTEAAQDALLSHLPAFRDPKQAQLWTLSRVIGQSTLTDARSLDEFRATVPIRSYDDFTPWIDRIAAGDLAALTHEAPVAFELTGGSSGGQKRVPMTTSLLHDFRHGLLAWFGDFLAADPDIAPGPAYFAISPALTEPRAPIGSLPVGLGSDLAYFGDLAPTMAQVLLYHPALDDLSDYDDWALATLAMMLSAPDLRLISVWSPSFLTGLLDVLDTQTEDVLATLHSGAYGLPPNPERAREIHSTDPADLWPNLRLISAWADASSARPAADLHARLSGIPFQPKGLLATEGLFTFPLMGLPAPLPALRSAFFEFRDVAGNMHLVDALEPGESYDLIVSTTGGLLRYDIGDRVICEGPAAPHLATKGIAAALGLPMLRFSGRGAGADLVGEKLTEAFVLKALSQLPVTAILAPVTIPNAGYELWLDTETVPQNALAHVEATLRENPQYAHARALGQLAPLRSRPCPGLIDTYVKHRLSRGARLSDVKTPALLKPDAAREIWG
ncbi:GH3 auxin-responsive promoter family protein [Aliiroseovarius subalbicans]|uniref:GH3 family domain-containing protein n=1 Tax=Aliiroseovarius subalbicans TaxID=2925840 RepID=UPI001F578BAB|nr:GH3 auxin-responsive promoter family protein [Aliiroseovarius subalbicans]MCI2400572.1 GH3 auxin-responsive promoter family protein [Aliiroseovarius subalbicans]